MGTKIQGVISIIEKKVKYTFYPDVNPSSFTLFNGKLQNNPSNVVSDKIDKINSKIAEVVNTI